MNWMTLHPWAAWLIAALLLAGAELLTLDFTLLMLAAGALAGGLTALALPGMWPVHIAVAAVTSVLLLAVLRPTLLRRVRQSPGYDGSAAHIVGGSGVALKQITSGGGEVRIAGETWSARSATAEPIDAGAPVEVERLDGVTVFVKPVHQTKQ